MANNIEDDEAEKYAEDAYRRSLAFLRLLRLETMDQMMAESQEDPPEYVH